ncbi:glycoside hydrolase [Penicillium atrosanguineum]|nr:glycoside hydrolase [Penicillium atrosanguineum]
MATKADWLPLDFHQTGLSSTITHMTDEAGSRIADFKFSGYPTKNESMVVPNPKDIVRKGLSDILGLLMEMQATMIEIMVRQWVNGLS